MKCSITTTVLVALAVGLLAQVAPLQAESEQRDVYADPGNLKVLPKDISSAELGNVMKGFAMGIGARCETCHVGEAGKPLQTFDFESDEKAMKRKARVMMTMLNEINSEHVPKLNAVEQDARVEVRCVTCHRGQLKPLLIEDVLDRELAENGLEATVGKYSKLREEFYGSHSYDFSEFTLPMYVQGLAAKKNSEAAIALAKVNAENFPESYYSQFVLAELYRSVKNNASAIEHYRKAMEIDPATKGFIQPRLDALVKE